MALSPFLVVLGGRERWRCRDRLEAVAGDRWRGVGIRRGHGGVVGDALEDGHQTGDDDDERPAVAPGEDVEGVQQEEDADEGDPDGAAQGAEEPELVAGGAVVCEAGAGVGHLANEEPDAEADEEEGNEPVDGKAVEEAGVADEEEAAKSDEPDGTGGKTVTREGA